MVDEMRWDCLSMRGHPDVSTPNLDRFAAGAHDFTRAYTSSPVCSPARMSLFTGRYTPAHRCPPNTTPTRFPAPNEVPLPWILQQYGYHTGIAGKIHLNGSGSRGFDDVHMFAQGDSGFAESGESYREWIEKRHPGLSVHCGEGTCTTEALPETIYTPDPGEFLIGTARLEDQEYQTAWAADHCIEFLREHRDDQTPWFFHCSTLHPHSPFVIPEPWASMYDPADLELPDVPEETVDRVRRKLETLEKPHDIRQYILDTEYLRAIMAKYYGAIRMVDHHFGRILDELDRLGLAETTLVVFVSDHGNMMGDHGRMFKFCMYDGSTRIPLMIRRPAQREANTVDEVVEITDVMPTLLDYCGIPIRDGIQGQSMLALMNGEHSDWKNTAFADLWDWMLVDGDFKLMTYNADFADQRHKRGDWKLFNLREDPGEFHDLADRPEHAGRIRKMKARIQDHLGDTPPPPAYP